MYFKCEPSECLGKDLELMLMEHFPFKGKTFMMWCGRMVVRKEHKDVIHQFLATKNGLRVKTHEYGHVKQAIDEHGEAQTTTILEQLGNNSTNAPAAYHCRAYTFPNGKKGYLGALGEWLAVIDNKDAIVSALSKCGGTVISDYYWTSTQNNSELSWLVIIKYDTPDTTDKNVNYSVRAFATI